ncbi:hypothetical protein RJT34_15760 [Clitoria ternatea]|uniref:DUF674 family protein n=1 Tax=Clitoria ternatea TaxID=43366 RepID=A0AAN9J745_CLITE
MGVIQTEEEQVSLKLLINRETNKVIFAEAGKEFVDVLFSFLTLPLGTIARLVQKQSELGPVRVGCLNTLYQSVENLDENCLWTKTCKEMLLQPRNSAEGECKSMKLNIDDTRPTEYLVCKNKHAYCTLSTFSNARCTCGDILDRPVPLKTNAGNAFEATGFVNTGSTFIITDDLVVMPNCLHTSVRELLNCGIKNRSSVQEMTVNVTKKKVLDLLKFSLLFKSVLTGLFLEKTPTLEKASFFSGDVVAEKNIGIHIKVKVVMRKSDGKILFVQGEEDFADFLFSFLTFPLGAVLRMLKGSSSVGNIDGLYKSIVYLDQCKYLISRGVKNKLVDPCLASHFNISKQMFPIHEQQSSELFYRQYPRRGLKVFHGNRYFLTNDPGDDAVCRTIKLVDPKSPTSGSSSMGYAKGPALFMVTDDLVLAPMTPISAISLLDYFKTPFSDLKEKSISLGIKEGLCILKACLISRSALTNGLAHLLTDEVNEGK